MSGIVRYEAPRCGLGHRLTYMRYSGREMRAGVSVPVHVCPRCGSRAFNGQLDQASLLPAPTPAPPTTYQPTVIHEAGISPGGVLLIGLGAFILGGIIAGSARRD